MLNRFHQNKIKVHKLILNLNSGRSLNFAIGLMAFFVFTFLLAGCDDSVQDIDPVVDLPAPLEKQHPMDGVIDFSALSGIQTATLNFFNMGAGDPVKQTNLRWAFDNDDRNIYIGIEWSDDTKNNVFDVLAGLFDYDMIRVCLDNDGNGVYEDTDDNRGLIAAFEGSLYSDSHGNDAEDDLIGDGIARMAYDSSNQVWQAEFLFPVSSDAAGEDGNVSTSTRYIFVFYDNWSHLTGGNLASQGDGLDSSTWLEVDFKAAEPHAYPTIPEDLTGLIVFVSTHEAEVGEIYTFDPVTKLVTRITQDPTLHKNSVSLSHDRSKIAFHGNPDPNILQTYRIYMIDVDGGNLTQLTNDQYMDLHPAWSPDDTRIAYSSFRELSNRSLNASTILMTAGGQELDDLTDPSSDESDVEYLRDGRIVYKTPDFAGFPTLNMGVVDAMALT